MTVYDLTIELNKIENSLKDLYRLVNIKFEDETGRKSVKIIGVFTNEVINGESPDNIDTK